jgi:hypothetical protein
LIKSQQNWLKQRVEQFALRSIISIWSKEELPEEWKESIIVPLYKPGDEPDRSNYRGLSLTSTTYKILSNILLSRLTPCARKLQGIISADFDATGQLWSYILHSSSTCEKMGIQWSSASALYRLQKNIWFSLEGSLL